MRRVPALLAPLLVLGGAGAAAAGAPPFGGGTLPKGFPYAAEISATISYDGTYHRASESDVHCNNGEDEFTLDATEADTLHFRRTVFFSHITVPVAGPTELGASVARLALSPTIASPGKIKTDDSTMDFEGSLPSGDAVGENCHTEKASCHWDIQGAPAGVGQTILSRTDGFLPSPGTSTRSGPTCSPPTNVRWPPETRS
jgi:hypothetical protein